MFCVEAALWKMGNAGVSPRKVVVRYFVLHEGADKHLPDGRPFGFSLGPQVTR